MAEMVVTLFTTMLGSAGAGAAAAGAGAAVAGTSSALTLLQGIGSAFAAISQIGGGIAKSRELKVQAEQQSFEAKNEYIAGKETSGALKLELAKTIGNQAVAFAAGGVDLSSVSAQSAKAQAIKDAETELSIGSNEALSRSLARRRAAANLRSQSGAAIGQGIMGAVQTGVNFGIDQMQRG
jgi:hypothetical protein